MDNSSDDNPRNDPDWFDPERHCGAKIRSPDADHHYCRMYKGTGTDHVGRGTCKRHGGCTPGGRKAAMGERMRTYGAAVKIHPSDALDEELARTHGHVLWLEKVIGELAPNALIWLQTGREVGSDSKGALDIATWGANVHPYVEMYQRERVMLVNVSTKILQLGMSKGHLAMVERQAAQIVDELDWLVATVIRDVGPDAQEPMRRASLAMLDRLVAAEARPAITGEVA